MGLLHPPRSAICPRRSPVLGARLFGALALAGVTLGSAGCGGDAPAERSRAHAAPGPGCATSASVGYCFGRKLPAVTELALAPDGSICLRLDSGTIGCTGARGMANGQELDGRADWTAVRRIGGLDDVVDVAVGSSGLACAATADGSLWCWGDPRLYAEQIVHAPSPRQPGRVTSTSDVVEIALAPVRGRSLVRKRDGSLWRWHWDNPGARIGVGPSSELERIDGLSDVDAIAMSQQASCVRHAGQVSCWGLLADRTGASVDLGDGERPRRVEKLPHAVDLSVGEEQLCVLGVEGAVHCARPAGEALELRAKAGIPAAAQLACGAQHCCALTKTGEVYCWGDNRLSQLGDGKPGQADPIRVAKLPRAHCIAALANRSCACVADAAPWCWGGAPGKLAAPAW